MNEGLQSVFKRESNFLGEEGKEENVNEFCDIQVTITRLMENQDSRKAQGSDGVQNWVLK